MKKKKTNRLINTVLILLLVALIAVIALIIWKNWEYTTSEDFYDSLRTVIICKGVCA